MPEEEKEVLRDIEEEVQRLLGERRAEATPRKTHVIRYFKSIEFLSEDSLDKLLRDGVILIALRSDSLESAKRLAEKLSKKIETRGGSIYFVKWPSLLVVGGKTKIEVYG